jgi:hypothetical protein
VRALAVTQMRRPVADPSSEFTSLPHIATVAGEICFGLRKSTERVANKNQRGISNRAILAGPHGRLFFRFGFAPGAPRALFTRPFPRFPRLAIAG